MGFTRITGLDHPISALEDRVSGRASWLKAYFDESPQQLLEALNALMDELESVQAAGSIGFTPISGLSANNLQAALEAFKTITDNLVAGVIPDQSITSERLSDGAVTQDKIAGGAVTQDKLAASSVSAQKLADGAVTQDKIAAGSVAKNKLAFDLDALLALRAALTGATFTGAVTGMSAPADSAAQFRNCVVAEAGADASALNVPEGTLIFIKEEEEET